MCVTDIYSLKESTLKRLSDNLDKRLTYHDLGHTLDVMKQAERIAKAENINDERQLFLLNLATLFHDTGFLKTYRNHEEESCRIFEESIENGVLSEEEIRKVKGMIMATKIPQSPTNLLEQIICDADLDYLGREDYPPISQRLKLEFLAFGVLQSEADWDPLQISFLSSHQYFTKNSREIRQPRKMEYLQRLKLLVGE